MHRRHHRAILTITVGMATLVLGAAPALAGSDGCSSDDCEAENAPPPAVVAPVPVAPPPFQEASPGPAHDAGHARNVRAHRVHRVHHVHRVHAAKVAHRVTVPRGAVAAGAGGTAPAGPDGVLALLGTGALVLVAAGGGLVATSRRAAS
jgi:hypothetical protein